MTLNKELHMTIVFEEFDPVKGFAPIVNEEPFKLDPAMPLELPGLIPGWPPKPKPLTLDPEPEIPPYYEDDDGDGVPNVFDPDHPLYDPPDLPTLDPENPITIPEPTEKPFELPPWLPKPGRWGTPEDPYYGPVWGPFEF